MPTLKELKEENAEPVMRPNETHTMYEPVNRAYFDWYYRKK